MANCFCMVPVQEATQVGEARRLVQRLSRDHGSSEQLCGRAALVATELASNLLKHGRDGELLVRANGSASFDLIGVDRGPGIDDVQRCFIDGYSTASSPGTGLGAISRNATELRIESEPGRGTVLWARLGSGDASQTSAGVLEVDGICRGRRGDPYSGDAWSLVACAAGWRLLVVDGLGHGPDAQQAARTAITIFEEGAGDDLVPLVTRMDARMLSGRGAAIAIAEMNIDQQRVRYLGIGNLAAALVGSDDVTRLVSTSGIVGHRLGRPRVFDYRWAPGAMLLVHSDGVRERWRADEYPGLRLRAPLLASAMLYRDYARDSDDAVLIAARGVVL